MFPGHVAKKHRLTFVLGITGFARRYILPTAACALARLGVRMRVGALGPPCLPASARTMNRRPPPLKPILACTLLGAIVGCCACLPRIDPTGERVFIWPKDQPRVATLAAPSSSIIAPPVTTNPVFPQAPAVAVAPGAIAAPGVLTAPGVTPASVALAQVPTDKVTITPERILAPVGSEVVLKASVCTTEGYTLADQKVEWMLGRNGVGQFVEVSGKGLFHPPLLPWNKPKKVDNYLAQGFTANAPLCINRGTPDPADDVNINRGDAWISVSSPNEGTSYVTAYMPTVDSWDTRKSAATIYWVDVQWNFPPPSIAGSGRGQTLTTTVTRQSNGTPIEGWIVRYAVNDGGGAITGGGAGQVVEMRTDAQGRATVDVAPTASGAASSKVELELIRPAGFGGGDAPRLVVGTGATVIQWGGASTPYLSPGASSPAPVGSPSTPTPALPDATPPATTIPPSSGAGASGAVQPIPPARPQLELEFRGDQQAAAGGVANLVMVIRNTGNAPATQVAVRDRIDQGLMYPPNPNSSEIDFTGVGTVLPGEQKERTIQFNVMQAGRLCHRATVTSAEGAQDTAEFCVTASQAREERTGHMTVSKDGPLQGFVGQSVLFRVTVKNDGQLPLTNIRILDEYPPALLAVKPPADLTVQIANGVVARTIDRLEVGQQRSFDIEATCVQPARPVIPAPLVRVTANTDPPTGALEMVDDHAFEILPARGPAAAVEGAPAGAPAANLGVSVLLLNPTARVGTRATCQVTVANKTTVNDENVAVRVTFPPQLTPDVQRLITPPGVQGTLQGNQLTFTPIATLRPGEPVSYTIPMNVNASGIVEIVAGALSKNAPNGASFAASQEIIP